MDPLYKNSTKYTKTNYEKYLNFHHSKYSLQYYLYTIIIILLLCFCIVTQIRMSNYGLVLIYIIILVCFLAYRIFNPIKKIKAEKNTEKFQKEITYIFTFYEKYFNISDNKNTIKISYLKIKKIHQTNEFFYLYIDKDHAFLMEKSKFTIGTPEKFQEFLKIKCPFKIKN